MAVALAASPYTRLHRSAQGMLRVVQQRFGDRFRGIFGCADGGEERGEGERNGTDRE